MAASETVTMSSTYCRMIGKLFSPVQLVRSPSAIVAGVGIEMRRSARKDCATSSASAGSTPITRRFGPSQGFRRDGRAAEQPAAADGAENEIEVGLVLQ